MLRRSARAYINIKYLLIKYLKIWLTDYVNEISAYAHDDARQNEHRAHNCRIGDTFFSHTCFFSFIDLILINIADADIQKEICTLRCVLQLDQYLF